MSENKIRLEFESNIDYMKVLEDDDDLCITQLDLLHLGTNRNQTNISKECVDKSLTSFYNKPLIYRLNNRFDPSSSTDVVEHARTEDQERNIFVGGIIPESSPVEFVDRNGLTYLRMTGVVYKLYQQTLYDIIKNRGGTLKVSIEILPIDAVQHEDDGVLYINEFKFLSVCLLGDGIEEGILGSQLQVTKYSLDDYNKCYLAFSHQTIKKEGDDIQLPEKEMFISKEELGSKDALVIDKGKDSMSEGSWSDSGIRKVCLEASNWKTVCKAVFLKLEAGWEDGKEGCLGYPVMEKAGNKVVYNHKGLASAKGYAEKNNETAVLTSLRAIYKHLGLEWDTSDNKENSNEKVKNVMENKTEKQDKPVEKEAEKDKEKVAEKEENATEKKCSAEKDCNKEDFKAKYEELKNEFDAMKNDMKKYQRQDEENKMSTYLEKFAHCYSKDELEKAKESIEKFSFDEFVKTVDDKVKEFVLTLKNKKVEDKKENEEKPVDKKEDNKKVEKNSTSFTVSPFMPKATYDFSKNSNSKDDLDSIINNANVKLKK